MKNLIIISILLCSPFYGSAQSPLNIEKTINLHLLKTVELNKNWGEVNTIFEEGYEEAKGLKKKFKIWYQLPNLMRYERVEGSKSSVSVINNDDQIVSPMGLQKLSAPIFNYSVALSKRDFYGLLISNKRDTIINDTLMYKVNVIRKTNNSFTTHFLFYFDAFTFYLRRIECTDDKYIRTIDFSNYKSVNGYVFPFTIKTKKKKDNFFSIKRIISINVNEQFDPILFNSQE